MCCVILNIIYCLDLIILLSLVGINLDLPATPPNLQWKFDYYTVVNLFIS